VAAFNAPLIAKGQVKGVLSLYHHASLEPDEEWKSFLNTLARQTAIAVDNAGLFDDLQRSNQELTRAYDTTLEGWAKALELRDEETEGHSQRVVALALRLGQAMGIAGEALVHLRRGALLHDIGKMSLPDDILFKPGPLNPENGNHAPAPSPGLSPARLNPVPASAGIPYCHHEKWDGSGYPRPEGRNPDAHILPSSTCGMLLSDRHRQAWRRR
jgi:HD-GYP domain-containing protein (c-di-GMP phosphodiesterase class II)